MGKLNITPISVDMPFIEDLLCTYLKYINVDYEKMLFLSWGFTILPEVSNRKNEVGYRISMDRINCIDMMEKYCGVIIREHIVTSKEEKLKRVLAEIDNGRGIIAECESMYLPYHRTYNKPEESHLHPILITGYSDTEVYLVDPGWLGDISYSWSLNSFIEAVRVLKTIEIDKKAQTFDLTEALNEIIIRVNTPKNGYNNMFDAISHLADLMENTFDITQEIKAKKYDHESLKYALFLFNMSRVDGSRSTMGIVFDYFYHKFEYLECASIADMFRQCVKKWAYVRYGMFKAIITNDQDSFKRYAGLLREISLYEKSILDAIIRLKMKIENSNKIVLMNLKKHYNENYFGEAGKLKSDSYIITETVPDDRIIDVGCKFKFPKIDGVDNVIRCLGQKIDVEENCYSTISIMGFAEYAGYVGEITVNYQDGTQSDILVGFNDFMENKPRFDEKVALKCDIYKYQKLRRGTIFYDTFVLDKNKVLKSFCLPEWDKLFIVAITLEK